MKEYNYDLLPEHMRGSMKRYLEQRIEPGSFLTAVLENNLSESFARADHINRERLFDIVGFLYNEAPRTSWGSPNKVTDWINQGKQQ